MLWAGAPTYSDRARTALFYSIEYNLVAPALLALKLAIVPLARYPAGNQPFPPIPANTINFLLLFNPALSPPRKLNAPDLINLPHMASCP